MRARTLLPVLVLLALGASAARGQSFDVPAFHPPYGEDTAGLYLLFPNDVTDVGVMGALRRSGAVVDLGGRAAVLGLDGEVGLSAGLDVKNELFVATPEFPLDVGWVTGIGITGVPERDVAQVRVPFGLSVGRELGNGEVSLTPYVHPRLALDFFFGPDDRAVAGPLARMRQGDDTTLHGDVDVGFDAVFVAGWKFRFAVTLGHNEAVGAGLSVDYF